MLLFLLLNMLLLLLLLQLASSVGAVEAVLGTNELLLKILPTSIIYIYIDIYYDRVTKKGFKLFEYNYNRVA